MPAQLLLGPANKTGCELPITFQYDLAKASYGNNPKPACEDIVTDLPLSRFVSSTAKTGRYLVELHFPAKNVILGTQSRVFAA